MFAVVQHQETGPAAERSSQGREAIGVLDQADGAGHGGGHIARAQRGQFDEPGL